MEFSLQRMGDKPPLKEVPDRICNPQTNEVFQKGKFLGKGGFARCYEMINTTTNSFYAGKIVSKTLLQKKHQKEKVRLHCPSLASLCYSYAPCKWFTCKFVILKI